MFEIFRKKKTNKELIALSKYVSNLCIDEVMPKVWKKDYVDHHLPLKDNAWGTYFVDNWNLEENVVNQILENQKELCNYASNIIYKYYKNKNSIGSEEMLPPWIVFPYYPQDTKYWRMGTGEAYLDVFNMYINSITEEDLEEYKEKYPIPKYFLYC